MTPRSINQIEAQEKGLNELYENGYLSDVQIKCSDGSTIDAHKCILSASSKFFAAAFNPNHQFKETQSRLFEMLDDPSSAIKAMVCFIYNCSYDIAEINKTSRREIGALPFHVGAYLVGETYLLPNLMEFALENLSNFEWLNDDNNLHVSDVLEAANQIYALTSTDDSEHVLRRYIVRYVGKNRYKLFGNDDKSENWEALLAHPRFLLEIAMGFT